MHKSLVVDGLQQLGGFIRGVVVDHDDIIFEVRLLREGRVDGIADGLFAVVDGNHHRSLHIKLLLVEVRPTIIRRIDLGTDLLQMGCGGILHLYLHLAIAGIHIVELLHARGPCVGLLFGIELLVDMEDLSVTAQKESQGIEACMAVIVFASLHGKGM